MVKFRISDNLWNEKLNYLPLNTVKIMLNIFKNWLFSDLFLSSSKEFILNVIELSVDLFLGEWLGSSCHGLVPEPQNPAHITDITFRTVQVLGPSKPGLVASE